MPIELTETLIQHAQTLYEALEERSEDEEVQGGTLKVFRGSVTQVYDSLGISRSYYTPITTLLRENDCVTYVQKGSRSVESVVVLHQKPSADGLTLAPLTGRAKGARLEARLKSLEKSLGGINIGKALADHEARLKQLESRRRGKQSGKT